MSDKKLGNQEEAPQDLDQLERDLESIISDEDKKAGPDAQKNTNDTNVVTEVIMAASPATSTAVHIMSDSLQTKGVSQSNFMLGGGGRKDKKAAKFDQLLNPNDAMGHGKTYAQKKQDMRTVNKILAGKNPGKDVFAATSGTNLMGDKVQSGNGAQQSKFLQQHLKRLAGNRSSGAPQELRDMLELTRKEKENPSATAIVVGAIQGDAKKQEAVKSLSTSAKKRVLNKMDKGVKQQVKKLLQPKPPTHIKESDKEKV